MGSASAGSPWIVRKLPAILVLMLIGAAALGVIAALVYGREFDGPVSSDAQSWAQFGDYIGGVLNPIYGFLALVALLLTIYVQLFELRQSTLELRSSAASLAKQNESLARQNFESTFFQMVRLHTDIVASIDLRSASRATGVSRITLGRDCFKVFYRRFSKEADAALRGDLFPMTYKEAIAECYLRFHENNEQNVGHYFRNLYRVCKFVAESNVADKTRYSGILRAQLSTFELCLLFYNGLGHVGEKFTKYAEQFHLFENLQTGHLLRWEEEKHLYSPEAFGDQAEPLGLTRVTNEGGSSALIENKRSFAKAK